MFYEGGTTMQKLRLNNTQILFINDVSHFGKNRAHVHQIANALTMQNLAGSCDTTLPPHSEFDFVYSAFCPSTHHSILFAVPPSIHPSIRFD